MTVTLNGSTGVSQPAISLVGSTSGTVTIQGAAAAGTWTFTLPTTAGTNGYVLQTNGAGVASWVALAGGGNVNSSGTPTANQIAIWTNSNTIQGVTNLPVTNLNSGTGASSTTFWRGDGTWATPAGGGGLSWQSVQTGNFTSVAGNAYPVNTTSGAITVTLPASPSAGNIVQITDYAGTFGTNNCTINVNGNKINSNALNVTLSTNRQSVLLVYIDATQGWVASLAFNTTALPQGISYLIVAGGGGGGWSAAGNAGGGGGGAGGLLTGAISPVSGTTYTVTVGAGGAGSVNTSNGSNGSNSSITGVTAAIGGGGGGSCSSSDNNGSNGGSGGGSAVFINQTFGGSGTAGQGNAGGKGGHGAGYDAEGGGGGAGGVGGDSVGSVAGAGGVGLASTITGSSVFYAGGGGGGGYSGNTPGAGGNGGGGAGKAGGATGTAGTANTGGGGGGGGASAGLSGGGGAGGSGVVILSILTSQYTGTTTGSPTVTTNGNFTILKFTASGSYTA